jgi:uncharacterized protein (TIGR02391 family)
VETLYSLFPEADELLKVRPGDLGPILLLLALHKGASFIPAAVTEISVLDASAGKDYPFDKKATVERLLNRSWNWLETDGFIEPSPGLKGMLGRRVLTETGMAVATRQHMQRRRLRAAMDFPKALLHPAIQEKGWAALMRGANTNSEGDIADAIRAAFIAVEDAVRDAGQFESSDYGVALMRRAFDPDKGPLRDWDTAKPKREREALRNLFVGAIGAYRNPVSHRTAIIELVEAQDQLLLASHLLRIVDARRPK